MFNAVVSRENTDRENSEKSETTMCQVSVYLQSQDSRQERTTLDKQCFRSSAGRKQGSYKPGSTKEKGNKRIGEHLRFSFFLEVEIIELSSNGLPRFHDD